MITLFLAKYASQLKLAGITAVVVFTLGVGWYIDHIRNENQSLKRDRADLMIDLSECAAANDHNMATISRLIDATENLRRAVAVSDEDRLAAIERARRIEADSKKRLDSILSELDKLRNEEPSCADIKDFDVGVVCPAAVERLRMQAGADSQD